MSDAIDELRSRAYEAVRLLGEYEGEEIYEVAGHPLCKAIEEVERLCRRRRRPGSHALPPTLAIVWCRLVWESRGHQILPTHFVLDRELHVEDSMPGSSKRRSKLLAKMLAVGLRGMVEMLRYYADADGELPYVAKSHREAKGAEHDDDGA